MHHISFKFHVSFPHFLSWRHSPSHRAENQTQSEDMRNEASSPAKRRPFLMAAAAVDHSCQTLFTLLQDDLRGADNNIEY